MATDERYRTLSIVIVHSGRMRVRTDRAEDARVRFGLELVPRCGYSRIGKARRRGRKLHAQRNRVSVVNLAAGDQRLREHTNEDDVVVAHELDRLGRSFADLAGFVFGIATESEPDDVWMG